MRFTLALKFSAFGTAFISLLMLIILQPLLNPMVYLYANSFNVFESEQLPALVVASNAQQIGSTTKEIINSTQNMQHVHNVSTNSNSSSVSMAGNSDKRSRGETMAVATTVSSSTMRHFPLFLIHARRNLFGRNTTIIIFDFYLSRLEARAIQEEGNCEVRAVPLGSQAACRVSDGGNPVAGGACKALLVYSLFPRFSTVMWSDVVSPPSEKWKCVLHAYPFGTCFIGEHAVRTTVGTSFNFSTAKDKDVKRRLGAYAAVPLVSTHQFVIFLSIDFFHRVVRPWVQCAADLSCADDVVLTILLNEYQKTHKTAVIVPISRKGSRVTCSESSSSLTYVTNPSNLDRQSNFLGAVCKSSIPLACLTCIFVARLVNFYSG